MSAVIVKRFVGGYNGNVHYSIRRRADGTFQIYDDGPYPGCDQPYQFDDKAISGLFADIGAAEAELLRDPQFKSQSSN